MPKLLRSHRLQCHGHQKFRPKNQIKMHLLSKVFQPYFPTHHAGNMSVYSVKSRFWTNEELSLMVAWSSSVSISHSKVQSSIGHLVTCNTGGKETNSPKCKLNFALPRKVTGYWSTFLKESFEPTEFLLWCRVLKPSGKRGDKIYLRTPGIVKGNNPLSLVVSWKPSRIVRPQVGSECLPSQADT